MALCSRSFHPKSHRGARIIEACFGNAVEHLLFVSSHRASSHPSSVSEGQVPLVPYGQQDVTSLPAGMASPISVSGRRRDQPSAAAPRCPHSIHLQSNGAVPSPPLPLTLPGPCHNLPSQLEVACTPLIEDSLSCQPLVSQHACES